ncbi:MULTISPECIES: XkdX family protein [Lysinibacillus]|nr:XkdX family protein [Lysinibacillus boronitolerans]
MEFWEMAYKLKWVTAEKRRIVITEANPFGEITPEQYKEITKQDFKSQA